MAEMSLCQIPRLSGNYVEVDSVVKREKRSEKRASGSTRDASGLGRSPKTVQVKSTLSGEDNFQIHRMSESKIQLQSTATSYGADGATFRPFLVLSKSNSWLQATWNSKAASYWSFSRTGPLLLL